MKRNPFEKTTGTAPHSYTCKGSAAGGFIAAIAFVLFFIADIIAMAIFAQTKPILCAGCLGVLLLLFGIVGVTQAKINWDTWPILLFPLIGVILIVVPILEIHTQNTTGETFFTTDRIAALVSGSFLIAGVLMIIMPFLKRHFLLQRCTESVTATCIFLDSRVHHGKHGAHRVYAPKWQYTVNGTSYEHQETSYTNRYVPNIGDEQEIFVNPEQPEEMYRDNKGVFAVVLPMGIIFVAVSLLTIYMVFFKQA